MINLINHYTWFQTCRPLKAKYNLSSNCLLCLIAIYLHYHYVCDRFTWKGIFSFITYYSPQKVAVYLTVLIENGYINKLEKKGNRQYYSISEKGIVVIRELEESYSLAFSRFTDKYDIKL